MSWLIIRAIGVTVGLLWMAACVAQDWLIFPRHLAPRAPTGPRYGERAELWTRAIPGGEVRCWFVPAPRAVGLDVARAGAGGAEARGPAVMFFHGNAEIADYLGPIVAGYGELGVHVLLMEYRGYGRSDGKPGQGVILEDAMFFHDLLASRPEVDRGRVFVHGRSLGGGAAADLARHRRPRAMVLESTFDSLAGHVSRLGLPAFLLRHPFRTDRVVAQADYPLLILHGVRDEVVPVSQGRRLNEAARERGVEVRYIEWDAGHNDFPPEEREAEYWAEIRALLVRAGVL